MLVPVGTDTSAVRISSSLEQPPFPRHCYFCAYIWWQTFRPPTICWGKSYLVEADLSKANLEKAVLYRRRINTDEHEANRSNAILSGANLSDASFTAAQLDHPTLEGTTMPDGSKHP